MSDVLVLCYHAVSPTWTADLSVTPERLDAQLRLLVRRGWRGSTFREAVLEPPWPRTLAVTFDDAFLSVFDHAYPILAELGLPATVFVPTRFPSQHESLRWDGIDHWSEGPDAPELRCMDWNDLSRLTASGWEIGSHTVTHPRLTRLDDAELRLELTQSKQSCEGRLGLDCSSLAYPYGDVDARVATFAREAGYQCAATLSSRLAPLGQFEWPRVGIYHGDSHRRFRLKVNSWIRFARRSRSWPTR